MATWGAIKEEIVLSLMEQGVGEDMPTSDLMLDKLGAIAKYVIIRIKADFRRTGLGEIADPDTWGD